MLKLVVSANVNELVTICFSILLSQRHTGIFHSLLQGNRTNYLVVTNYYDKQLQLPQCDEHCDFRVGPSLPTRTTVMTSTQLTQLMTLLSVRSSPVLPWCSLADIAAGYWVSRVLWKESESLTLLANSTSANVSIGQTDFHLSSVLSGDVATALQRPYTWIPTKCRAFRYNVSSFLR